MGLGTTETLIERLQDPASLFSPVASPDGRHVAYIARISANNELMLLDLQTFNRTPAHQNR